MSVKSFLLKKLFPQETVFFGRNGNEVNGLPEGVIPQGNIIDQFTTRCGADRTFYLVEIDTIVFLLRITKAGLGSKYHSFAVVHASSLTSDPDKINQTYYRWKESL